MGAFIIATVWICSVLIALGVPALVLFGAHARSITYRIALERIEQGEVSRPDLYAKEMLNVHRAKSNTGDGK